MGLLNSNSLNEWITGLPGSIDQGLANAANYDPAYTYGSLLPFRVNKKTKGKEFALPGLLKDVARAITAPQRAYDGLLDPMSAEGVQEATSLAGLLQLGGAGMAVAKNPKKLSQPGTLGATVYHGSPHKFNKFDMSKIGTGEGAQAYGHGLYMAESPEVAKSYVSLGHIQGNTGKIGSKEITDYYSALESKANQMPHPAAQEYYDRMALVENLMNNEQAGDVLKYATDNGYSPSVINWFKKEVMPSYAPAGNLYKVDIPDEAIPRMLDWDKPLSEQPHVAKALKDYADLQGMENYIPQGGTAPVLVGRGISGDTKGQDVYKFFGKDATSPDAAGNLKAFGIPGIRYLDGNSRGVGGTSNYVLFDDQLPRILEVNGQPTGLLSWADEAKKTKKK